MVPCLRNSSPGSHEDHTSQGAGGPLCRESGAPRILSSTDHCQQMSTLPEVRDTKHLAREKLGQERKMWSLWEEARSDSEADWVSTNMSHLVTW